MLTFDELEKVIRKAFQRVHTDEWVGTSYGDLVDHYNWQLFVQQLREQGYDITKRGDMSE